MTCKFEPLCGRTLHLLIIRVQSKLVKNLAIATTLIFSPLLCAQEITKTPELCTVSGQVLSDATGEPLRSARLVLIQSERSEKPRSFKGISDNKGQFSINGILPGRYRFFASHNGYVPESYRPEGASRSGALLELIPGQKQSKVLFRLTQTAAIVGRITDEDGEPVSGVEVEAVIARSKAAPAEDQDESLLVPRLELIPSPMPVTNDLGEYRLYSLPPGQYYIAAIDSGMPDLTEAALRGRAFGFDL